MRLLTDLFEAHVRVVRADGGALLAPEDVLQETKIRTIVHSYFPDGKLTLSPVKHSNPLPSAGVARAIAANSVAVAARAAMFQEGQDLLLLIVLLRGQVAVCSTVDSPERVRQRVFFKNSRDEVLLFVNQCLGGDKARRGEIKQQLLFSPLMGRN